MKLYASPFVVRVWMPMMFALGVYLFFHDMAPEYWVVALPLLLIITFMSTLAEIKDEGHRIHVKTIWHSVEVPKAEVASVAQSLVEGVGVLRLHRFVFPWGRIYFVSDWSTFGVVSPERGEEHTGGETKLYSLARATIEPLIVAISGFLAARAMRSGLHDFGIETFAPRVAAFTLMGALWVVFAIAGTRRPGLANVMLFVSTVLVGFIH